MNAQTANPTAPATPTTLDRVSTGHANTPAGGEADWVGLPLTRRLGRDAKKRGSIRVTADLIIAAQNERPVTIRYVDRKGVETLRTIEPYELEATAGGVEVHAMDRLRGERRSFLVKSIEAYTVHVKRSFELAPDLSFLEDGIQTADQWEAKEAEAHERNARTLGLSPDSMAVQAEVIAGELADSGDRLEARGYAAEADMAWRGALEEWKFVDAKLAQAGFYLGLQTS